MLFLTNPFDFERLSIHRIMRSYNQKTSTSKRTPVLQNIERLHPYKMINYLVISISCILFAFISFLFISHLAGDLKGQYEYALPKFFMVSTIVLIFSMQFTSKAIKAYETDSITSLKKLLSYILVSGVIYFLSQSLAVMELLRFDFTHKISGITNYLFLFSGIHFVFVFTGIVIAAMLFYQYMIIENDPVKTLIITTNPSEKVKLEIFKTFWNFAVYSWTLIFLMFLFIF